MDQAIRCIEGTLDHPLDTCAHQSQFGEHVVALLDLLPLVVELAGDHADTQPERQNQARGKPWKSFNALFARLAHASPPVCLFCRLSVSRLTASLLQA